MNDQPSPTARLPRAYQLCENIAASARLIGDYPAGVTRDVIAAAIVDYAQELVGELWRAGQTERAAGMGTIESDYDAPLWCRGAFIEEVTAACQVPTVAASDPAKDLGRGRSRR